jgi:hypothetical protein
MGVLCGAALRVCSVGRAPRAAPLGRTLVTFDASLAPTPTSHTALGLTAATRFFPNKNSFRKSVSNPAEMRQKHMGG